LAAGGLIETKPLNIIRHRYKIPKVTIVTHDIYYQQTPKMKKPEKIEDLALFWHNLDMDFIALPKGSKDDFSPINDAALYSTPHLFFCFMFADFICKMSYDYTLKTYDCFSREVDLCFNEKEEEEYYQGKRRAIQKKIKKNFYFKNHSIGFKDFPEFFYQMDTLNSFYRIFEVQNITKLKEFDFYSDYDEYCEFFKGEIEDFFKIFKDLNQYLILNILEKNKKTGDTSNNYPLRQFDRNQIVLLMDRLKMVQAIEDKPTTVQAKIISEITGFGYDNIRKSLTSLNKKQGKLTHKEMSDKDKADAFVEALG